MGVPLMGRGNLCTCVGIHTCGAQHAPILVLCYDDKKLLALFGQEGCGISNTQRNSCDCFQPPDHHKNWWFFRCKKSGSWTMKHSIFSVIGVVSVIMLPYTAFAVSSGGGNIDWGGVDHCISGCINCAVYETASCCIVCNDSSAGGGGGSGYACTSYAQCPSISGRTPYTDIGSAASVGDAGMASSNNICFDINGIQYYKKSAVSCRTDYTKVKYTIHGCSNIVFYECLYNRTTPSTGNCDESTCVPDAWELITNGSTKAVQARTHRGCNNAGQCVETLNRQVRCPTGYWGLPNINFSDAITAWCEKCPSHASGTQTTSGPGDIASGGLVVGGGTAVGTVPITECFVPAGNGGSDESGTYVWTQNCYYAN